MFESFEREPLLHRAPSVGSITKKIMDVNPHLSAKAIMDIVRRSIDAQGGLAGEFSSAEVIDEDRALELARESLLSN